MQLRAVGVTKLILTMKTEQDEASPMLKSLRLHQGDNRIGFIVVWK